LSYLITDRRIIPRATNKSAGEGLLDFVKSAIVAGVDLVQIRERDLPGRDLLYLTQRLAKVAIDSGARLLVNDRADIAAACQGAGVHLATRSLPVAVVRKTFGDQLLIGASTHSLEEACEAEDGGANFVVFGPVFETASKLVYGPPLGLEALQAVTGKIRIPVLAIGGIKLSNFREVLKAGAQGIAAISLFTDAENLPALVRTIKLA
jgi:thiamine-phosphate pyrophosphorylase